MTYGSTKFYIVQSNLAISRNAPCNQSLGKFRRQRPVSREHWRIKLGRSNRTFRPILTNEWSLLFVLCSKSNNVFQCDENLLETFPSLPGIWTAPGSKWVYVRNGITIGSAVFAQHTDTQTDIQTCRVQQLYQQTASTHSVPVMRPKLQYFWAAIRLSPNATNWALVIWSAIILTMKSHYLSTRPF